MDKLYVDGPLPPQSTAAFQDTALDPALTADVLGGPVVFRRTANPHAGCFFLSTAQTALTTAIKANDTAGMTTQATTIGTTQGQITLIQAKADAAFYALLTSAQQTKLTDFGDLFPGMGPGGLHIPGGGH